MSKVGKNKREPSGARQALVHNPQYHPVKLTRRNRKRMKDQRRSWRREWE